MPPKPILSLFKPAAANTPTQIADLVPQRLANQHLTRPDFETATDVVAAQGAVQAQDYVGAKWALAQRMAGAVSDAELDTAFNAGTILRTHVLRPTWHFVTPADIRWMLELTAPRVHAANAFMYRKMELDDALFKKSNAAVRKALQGGKHLTRAELGKALEAKGISTQDGMRLGYIVHRAELDRVVCSGPRRGKQFTYALLDERAPHAKSLPQEQALFELTKRYIGTRGPVTVQDFVWWSGLTLTDAKKGFEMTKSLFRHETIGERMYAFPQTTPPAVAHPNVFLLPNYDEYFIGYRDRSAFMNGKHAVRFDPGSMALNAHIVMLDGQIVGGWRRTLSKTEVNLEFSLLAELNKSEQHALVQAANRFGKFLGLRAHVT